MVCAILSLGYKQMMVPGPGPVFSCLLKIWRNSRRIIHMSTQLPNRSSGDRRTGGQSRPRNALAARLFIIGFVALVVVPMFVVGVLPSERKKWLEARAIEQELNGEYSEALSTLKRLVALEPSESRDFRMSRVELLLEMEEFEQALIEAESIVADFPGPRGEVTKPEQIDAAFEHQQLLARCYQSLGKYDHAAKIWKEIQQQAADINSPMLINSLAYANGLADIELYKSWDSMNGIVLPGYHEANLYHMSAFMHYMLLRDGERFLADHLDERERVFQLALRDYSKAIQERKRLLTEFETYEDEGGLFGAIDEVINDIGDLMTGESLPEADEDAEQKAPQDQLDQAESDSAESEEAEDESKTATQLRKDLALLYVHRAKLFELVDDMASAEHDWDVVKELGFSRRTLGRQEIDPNVSLRRLSEMSAWLDTRGYLIYRMGRHRIALKDMNHAIRFMESLVSVSRFMECQRALHSPDTRRESQTVRLMQKGLAVLIYHRYLVNQALEDKAAAQADLERIKELGEVPGDHLF